MSTPPPVRIGVIGLGFMGTTHLRAIRRAAQDGLCTLAALCDRSAERRAALAEETDEWPTDESAEEPPRIFEGPDALLADPTIGAVSICTHTDTHVPLAIAALEAGKDVLLEKPVAIDPQDVARVSETARTHDRRCMPAMCMRFWPEWHWLKTTIDARTFGDVRSAAFCRLGSLPAWGREFYPNADRSGGALVDLHIHDADFVRWCFGDPQEVSTSGYERHFTTAYRYRERETHITAEGAWDLDPACPFRMRYTVAFERATADFDVGRDPTLIVHTQGRAEPVTTFRDPDADAYANEMIDFLHAVRDRTRPLRASLADAEAVARLLQYERKSLESGQPVSIAS